MPVRAVLFDFDGTLADSFSAISASTNHVLRHFGKPELPEEVIRKYVGLGLANLMETLLPEVPTSESVACYREHHPSVMLTMTRLMPGVAETLPLLQQHGVAMAVCSNKSVMFSQQIVGALGLTPYFQAVLGPEDVGIPKPDPAMLLEACRRLGIPKEETLYIGDMAVDVHTARAAGIPVWLVLGGAEGQESATATRPDRILNRISELSELVPGHTSSS